MADVAARAGVSRTLVSFILDGKPGASEETKQRVLAVAEEIGYRPDSAARLLARGRSRTLGVLMDVRPAVRGRTGHRHLPRRRGARLRGAPVGQPPRSRRGGAYRRAAQPPLWRADPARPYIASRLSGGAGQESTRGGRRSSARRRNPGSPRCAPMTPRASGWRSTTSSTSATGTSTTSTAAPTQAQRSAGRPTAAAMRKHGLSDSRQNRCGRPQRGGRRDGRQEDARGADAADCRAGGQRSLCARPARCLHQSGRRRSRGTVADRLR